MESEVLRQFYSDIQHAITDPIAVASLLHQEDVVGEVLLDEVSPSNKITYPEKTASIMRHVDAAIRVDPKSFWVFLSVLDQFTPCYKVAMRMKQAVDLHALAAEGKRSLPSSQNSKDDHEVTVSVVYKKDFDAIEKEFVSLHLRASHIIFKSSVTLQELKELLSFYPQLVMPIRNAESVTEVMQVIQQHSSFINCSYLKHVAEYFNLTEVTKEIDNYNNLVDDFCNSEIIQHSYMKPFTTNPPQYTMSSQTIKIKIMLEWNPATKTLSDIRSLLRKVFKGLSSLIHVDVIGEGSVTVVCYAPHYLMGALLKMTRKNKSILLENSVSYLSIGYAVVLDSTSQKKELEEDILVLKERKTSSLTSLQESVIEKTSAKRVYTEFYHQLVDAVSDPHTCQSLTAQLRSTTLISQEKITQLSSGQHTGSSFLKVLGMEEDPQLLTVVVEKMANVEQLQTLWKSMSNWLSTMKQDDESVTTPGDEQASGQLSTADVTHYHKVRPTASKEEQQQLLQHYQRMSHARDVQISQLQNENELVQDNYDALKASYLQLQAASNEKQSVDSVDTGVQTDYLTVAPGETSPEDTELSFTSLKFYKAIPGTLKVEFIFVVVYNHELFLKSVRQEYVGYYEDKPSLTLAFDEDVIVLDLPGSPPQVIDDWKILPLTRPEIARVDIVQFKRGRNVPACTVELEWTGSGEPKRLSHQVKIFGAKKPAHFYLRYYPKAVGIDETPSLRDLCKHLLPELAPRWEQFCIATDLDEDGTILGIIEKECRGDPEACCRMLFRKWIQSSKRPTWGRVIECLKMAKCGQLANKVEKQIQQCVHEEETDQSLSTVSTATKGEQSEQSPETKNTQPHSLLPQDAAELVSQQSHDITSTEPKPISLLPPSKGGIREYQRELAKPGLNGENYIICAPTGSGKTLVAAMIISEHLKKGQEIGEERKVLFMVKTRQLAHQQKEQLEKYVGGVRIAKVLGETGGGQMLVAPILSMMDLIVCTAGKIRNELQNKSVMIGQFSLIVVDECHHTVGSDQYSEVLEFYLMEKFEGKNRLPQVIGLTASPGAGRGWSPTLIKAISHQLDLCAHLDAACGIKMVTDNIDELRQYTREPDHILRELQSRSSSEAFLDLIIQAMKRLEDFIKDVPPYRRNSLQYRKWVEIEKEAAELRRSPDERDRISALELLGQYYHALITYEDFTSDDAIEVLKETEYFPDQQATPVEQSLVANHDSLLLELSKLPPVSNPLLEGVERIIVDQFTSKPASKAIIFVREIRHTCFVQRWVESCPSLRDVIRVSSIVGYTRAGMSKEQQLEAIRGFRSGRYNLLVSTSVLEEGIDVAACNLVIRFQNETAEVQAQGRARTFESKMYTILASQSEKQCLQLINEEKKLLALKTPSLVTELCKTPKFSQKQASILAEREARERANTQRKLLWKPEEVDVVCKKCKIIACKGSDIYWFATHYVVPNPMFHQTKMVRRPHHKTVNFANMHSPYKIFCRNCNQDWGNWSWWASQCVEYPVLKCTSFTFHHRGEVLSGKQWKKVQFEIKPLPADFDNDKPDPADLSDTS